MPILFFYQYGKGSFLLRAVKYSVNLSNLSQTEYQQESGDRMTRATRLPC